MANAKGRSLPMLGYLCSTMVPSKSTAIIIKCTFLVPPDMHKRLHIKKLQLILEKDWRSLLGRNLCEALYRRAQEFKFTYFSRVFLSAESPQLKCRVKYRKRYRSNLMAVNLTPIKLIKPTKESIDVSDNAKEGVST